MDSTGANRVYIHLREQHVAPGECGFRVHVTLWQQEEDEGFPVAYRYGDGPTVVSALEAASFSLRDWATKQGIVDLWHPPGGGSLWHKPISLLLREVAGGKKMYVRDRRCV